MIFDKAIFRNLVGHALEDRGYRVHDVKGRGIPPGSQLEIVNHEGDKLKVLVRTSSTRRISVTWHGAGHKALYDADLVLVAVPAADQLGVVEILAFDALAFRNAFHMIYLRTRQKQPGFSGPISAPIDDSPGSNRALSHRVKWRAKLALPSSTLAPQKPKTVDDEIQSLLEDLRRAWAKKHDLDEDDVEIRVTTTLRARHP